MRAFIVSIVAVIVVAAIAALISTTIDESAQRAYQAHDGSVRLSGR